MARLLFGGALAFTALFAAIAPAQSNVNPTNKFAWGENVGWTNWADANGGLDGVLVEATFLGGFVWGENVGWINLGDGSPANGTSYANVDGTNHGINIAIDGTLSGLAWGENIGWVNFDTSVQGANRARFDVSAGRFRGFAWGENVGWLNLDDGASFVGVDLPRPSNDACGSAIAVSDGTTMGTLIAATNDGSASCGASSSSPDVWYSYTATCSGDVTFSTCGTHDTGGVDNGVDTVLSLHSGCPGNSLNELACNDNSLSGCSGSDSGVVRDSSVILAMLAGETVLIRVSNTNNTATGPITLNIECVVSLPQFQRGDCNNDGAKNIADPVRVLTLLVPPTPPSIPVDCDSACDANDDGGLDIADAVAMLNVLFPSGPSISWPDPDGCGIDPTLDSLTCDAYSNCP
ncbi:MAG: hypothetical protein AAF581_15225 [Planctomycetota bacterium]